MSGARNWRLTGAATLLAFWLSPQASALPLQDVFPDASVDLLEGCLPESISTCLVIEPVGVDVWAVQLASEKQVEQAVFGVIGAGVGAFGGCSAEPDGTRRLCDGAPAIGDTVSGPDSFTVGPEDFGVGRLDTLYISLLSPAGAALNELGDPVRPVFLGTLTFPGDLSAGAFTLEGVGDLFGLPAFVEFETDGASLDAEVGFVLIPEPAPLALAGPALAALMSLRRRSSRRRLALRKRASEFG